MPAVAIRADSSTALGGGHVMRCLALAEELCALKAEVAFVSRAAPGSLDTVITGRGFMLHALTPSTDSARDAAETVAALASTVEWMAVDHYALDAAWERYLRESGAKNILAIDDLARSHDCDVLLDQNAEDAASRYRELVPAGARLLLGPRYALLQREYRRQRRALRARQGACKRVLVCFGASDGTNQTPKALRALAQPQFRGLDIDVVVGRSNRNAQAVEALCAAMPNARFHYQADYMPELIAAADLGIGAAGSMTWERACLGLPALVLVCADNQKRPAVTAARAGASLNLGWKDDVDEALIARSVAGMRDDPAGLARMSAAGMRLVDAEGARRTAENMLGFRIVDAEPGDAEEIWRWANDPVVRAQAFQSEPIPLESHMRWYSQRLDSAHCRIYVAKLGSMAVGQVRFEVEAGRATVDISVDSAWRGRGLGARILDLGLQRLGAESPDIVAVAQVKTTNTASQDLFAAAGFSRRVSRRADAVEFERRARDPASAYNP